MLKNKNLTKKTQFNIRLDAVSQAQLYLIKNKHITQNKPR